ncbi:MAG: flagellar biosynthetic protein FliO [Actinomycetota bacterium]
MDAISTGALIRLVVSVAVLVVALLAVKRWADRSGGRSRSGLRIVARVPITRGSSVALVELGDRHYLVGAAEQGVTLIDRLEAEDVRALGLGGQEEPAPSPDRTIAAGGIDPPAPGSLAFVDITTGRSDGPGIGPLERLRRMTLRAPGRVRPGGPGD